MARASSWLALERVGVEAVGRAAVAVELDHLIQVGVGVAKGQAQARLLVAADNCQGADRMEAAGFKADRGRASKRNLAADVNGLQADYVGVPQLPQQHDLPHSRDRDAVALLRDSTARLQVACVTRKLQAPAWLPEVPPCRA